MRRASLLAGMLGLAMASQSWAGLTGVQIQAFNVNTGMILELYNQAQANGGTVSNYPTSINPALVTVSIANNTDTDVTPCFVLTVRDPQESGCGASQTIVTSPPFTAKAPMKAHTTKIYTANDFTNAGGGFNGSFCTQAQTDLKNEFGDVNQSNAGAAIQKILQRKFQVCITEADCSSPSSLGTSTACSIITLFTPNPGAMDRAATLSYPHNQNLTDCNINFLWSPAGSNGLSPSDISYTLVITDSSGAIFTRIDVSAGQTSYTYGASNPELTKGATYNWYVIARNSKTGKTIGSQDGSGASSHAFFSCGSSNKCDPLAAASKIIAASPDPAVKKALDGMHPVSVSSSDFPGQDALCGALNSSAAFKISVSNK
jgi:hypothetical protein